MRYLKTNIAIFVISIATSFWVVVTHDSHPPYHGHLVRTLLILERLNSESGTDENPNKVKDMFGNSFLFDQKKSMYYSSGKDGIDNYGDKDDITDSKKEYTCRDYSMNCPRTISEILGFISLGSAVVSLIFIIVITFGLLLRRLRVNET